MKCDHCDRKATVSLSLKDKTKNWCEEHWNVFLRRLNEF